MRKFIIGPLLCAIIAVISTPCFAANEFHADFEDGAAINWNMPYGSVSVKKDNNGNYLELQGSGTGNRTCSYSLGETFSGEYTIEFDTAITRGDGMGRYMHSSQIAFTNDTKTLDTRGGDNAGLSVANAAFKADFRPHLKNGWLINEDSTAELDNNPEETVYIKDATWVRVQAYVNNAQTYVTIIDKTGNKYLDNALFKNSLNPVDSIYVCSNRGVNGSGIVSLDNINVYSGSPKALNLSGLRGELEYDKPMPTPDVYFPAPVLVAPEGAQVSVNEDFSSGCTYTVIGKEEQDVTDFDGINIHLGAREYVRDTYVTSSFYADNMCLIMAGDNFSTSGRGPLLSAVNPLSHDESTSSVMTFAVNLSSEVVHGQGRLYILGTKRQAEYTGEYNTIMGVLSTDGDYSYTDGDSGELAINVKPYTWYKVAVVTSADKYRIWVAESGYDFKSAANIARNHVGRGNSSISANDLGLPYLAVTSGEATNSYVRIDNLLTYTNSNGSNLAKNMLPSEDTDAQGEPEYPFELGELLIKNMQEEEISDINKLEPNQVFIVDTDVLSMKYGYENNSFIAAIYGTEGSLLYVKDGVLMTDEYDRFIRFELPAQQEEIKKIKVFVWKNKTVTPLSKVINFPQNI